MKKYAIIFFFMLLIAVLLPVNASANSAEPPTLIIIAKNSPSDLSISVVSTNETFKASRKKMAWETYYAVYSRNINNKGDIELLVSGNGFSYTQIVGAEYLKGYNSIITLDFANQTIMPGKLLSRSILLVSLRVLLTLTIEGIIFFLFGFRRKRSWLAFLVINLLTQGMLNIVLNSTLPFNSYAMLGLIIIEFFIYILEIAGFLAAVKEHGRLKRVLYVLAANTASLFLGGYFITVLPV